MANLFRINRMETRFIKLSLETAKRWYEQGGEQKDIALEVFTLEELGVKLPSTFDEYLERCAKWEIKLDAEDYTDRNPQIEALKKLILLRDFYNNSWKPDWDNIIENKFHIKKDYDRETKVLSFDVVMTFSPSTFLTFNNSEYAHEFLTNFREIIEQAGDLI